MEVARGLHNSLSRIARMPTTLGPQEGDRVSFRIADVFLPEPEEALAALTVDTVAQGIVVEFSDSGAQTRTYAVVEITPRQKVLVPMSAIQIVAYEQGDQNRGQTD